MLKLVGETVTETTALDLFRDTDKVLYLRGNGINLAWFDENDKTLNLISLEEDEKARLPGLGFDSDDKLAVYGD